MKNSTRVWLLVAIAFVLLSAILVGTLIPYGAINDAKQNTTILRCQAAADQQFRRDLTELLAIMTSPSGRDLSVYQRLVERMGAEATLNYAELDHGKCPEPIKEP